MEATTALASVRERVVSFPWSSVVGVGGGTFLLGYLSTVAIVVLGPSQASGSLRGILASIAFVFYSAQNISVRVPELGYINWLEFVGQPGPPEPSVPLALFYLVPLVALLVAGGWAALAYGDDAGGPTDAVLVSAGITAGYWAFVIGGTFVFRTPSAFGVQTRLSLPEAAVFGLVYPFVVSLLAAGLVQFARTLRAGRVPAG